MQFVLGELNWHDLFRFDSMNLISRKIAIIIKKDGKKNFSPTRRSQILQSWASITVTDQQVAYEFARLQKKLRQSDQQHYELYAQISQPELHPLFVVISDQIEPWEKL